MRCTPVSVYANPIEDMQRMPTSMPVTPRDSLADRPPLLMINV